MVISISLVYFRYNDEDRNAEDRNVLGDNKLLGVPRLRQVYTLNFKIKVCLRAYLAANLNGYQVGPGKLPSTVIAVDFVCLIYYI